MGCSSRRGEFFCPRPLRPVIPRPTPRHSVPLLSFRASPHCHSERREESLLPSPVIPSPLLSFRASPHCHFEPPPIVILSAAKNLFSRLKGSVPKILRSEAPQNDSISPFVILSAAKNLLSRPVSFCPHPVILSAAKNLLSRPVSFCPHPVILSAAKNPFSRPPSFRAPPPLSFRASPIVILSAAKNLSSRPQIKRPKTPRGDRRFRLSPHNNSS